MKKLFALVLVLFVFASSSMATNGKGDSKKTKSSKNFSIERTEDNTFMLKVNTLESGFVKVKILTDNNQFIDERTISYDHSVRVPFDLSNLKEGKYKFLIQGPGIKGTQAVFLSKMHEKDVAAFVEEVGNNKVKLTVYRENTPVTVSLVDEDGQQYYQESIGSKTNFAQVFDLSDVQDKNMMLVIRGNKSTVSKVL